jgi:transposase-like protein
MAGRKPLGPALVEHLDGSQMAKERLELILQTLTGQVTVVAAAERLDISEAMFYKVRNRVLQGCVEDLEPKPRGRPPQFSTPDQERCATLTTEVTALHRELRDQTVRLEAAQIRPQAQSATPVKKTTQPTLRRRQRQPKSK